ncbi:MAG: DUF1559 domain-containing protein [Pirellulales bacterium]|nr:DUF1559 domain-containing protein [Pirellulales bacterium]
MSIASRRKIGFSKCRSKATRQAFTLVELLVVIAIIGILVALLLPAIQAAREAARRMSCGNNLKQLGLAFQNYHSSHRSLPFGSAWGAEDEIAGTWFTMLMPFLEEQTKHDRLNPNVLLSHPDNEIVVTSPISMVICPSDDLGADPILDNRRQLSNNGNPIRALGLWYPACMGPTPPDFCSFSPDTTPKPDNLPCQGCGFGTELSGYCSGYRGDFCTGMICRSIKAVSFRQVTDGLSNTILAGETLPGHCVWNCAFCPNFGVASTHIPINVMETDDGVPQNYWRTSGYKSYHPGGAHVLLGDGSTHFVNETIDYFLYNGLGTIAGGEPVSLGDSG